ncbi:protein CTLA-2-alpha-like [Neodiprion pinetum]|uniref:protein CTLA-2-alpha-like n=1 Tax=Neodiprion pinetum TaxID=441929 RepID=UPI00076F9995|nr:protein CTLA-2-alpha-like [Neodiprion pinetum]
MSAQSSVNESQVGAANSAISMPGLDLDEWNAFKAKHNKKYETVEEEKKRMTIYLESKEKIAKHNADFEKGITTFKMGINHFADMTPEERKMGH